MPFLVFCQTLSLKPPQAPIFTSFSVPSRNFGYSHKFMHIWDAESRLLRRQTQLQLPPLPATGLCAEGQGSGNNQHLPGVERAKLAKNFRATLLCILSSYPKIIMLVCSQLQRRREEKTCCSCFCFPLMKSSVG